MIKKVQMKYGNEIVNTALVNSEAVWNPGLQYTLIDITDQNNPVIIQTGDTNLGVCHYNTSEPVLPASTEITSYEFFNLFTKDERIAIRSAAKQSADLEDWLSLAQAAQTIDLAHPDVNGGLSLLVAFGLLTAGRKTSILNKEAP